MPYNSSSRQYVWTYISRQFLMRLKTVLVQMSVSTGLFVFTWNIPGTLLIVHDKIEKWHNRTWRRYTWWPMSHCPFLIKVINYVPGNSREMRFILNWSNFKCTFGLPFLKGQWLLCHLRVWVLQLHASVHRGYYWGTLILC